jgi:hypothetical protein
MPQYIAVMFAGICKNSYNSSITKNTAAFSDKIKHKFILIAGFYLRSGELDEKIINVVIRILNERGCLKTVSCF